MKILACDPGYERLGIAVLASGEGGHPKLIHSECFRTSASFPFEERLLKIGERLITLIDEHVPDHVAFENVFFTTNKKTAFMVAEVKGVIRYLAASRGIRAHEFSPPDIKLSVTGDGGASKHQIMRMVPLLVRGLRTDGKLDDELDAIAVGITALSRARNLNT
jgi:crossover junction endodeoxyribonuclease RuvC